MMSSEFNRREFLGISGATMMAGLAGSASGQTTHSALGDSPESADAGEPLDGPPASEVIAAFSTFCAPKNLTSSATSVEPATTCSGTARTMRSPRRASMTA